MKFTEQEIKALVDKVIESVKSGDTTEGNVPVGISNRQIHLTKEDVETLFGKGYELTKLKDLSQPGQYACKEQLTIVGPSMRPIEGVRVLGPERKRSQVEISRTDSQLGYLPLDWILVRTIAINDTLGSTYRIGMEVTE